LHNDDESSVAQGPKARRRASSLNGPAGPASEISYDNTFFSLSPSILTPAEPHDQTVLTIEASVKIVGTVVSSQLKG